MKKNLLHFLILILLVSSCSKDESGYSILRKYFPNAFVTKKGADLHTAGLEDANVIGSNGLPIKSAYYAIIQGEFTDVEDSIVEYGHCWSTDPENQNPFINKRDTSTYSKLGSRGKGETGTFKTYIPNLFPETDFYVRSYVITAKGDTGYNKVVFTDRTLSPVNEWFRKAEFPGIYREGAVSFTMMNETKEYECGYVFGGWNGLETKKDFFEYDPKTDTWQQINSVFQGDGRRDAVGFSITYYDKSGKKQIRAFVGLGSDNQSNTLNDWWEYIPSINYWKAKEDMPIALSGAVGFVIGSKGYIGTGSTVGSADILVSDFYSYDPEADTTYGYPWKKITKFANSDLKRRKDAIAFVVDNYAFVGFGEGDGLLYNDLWLFVPGDDVQSYGTWVQKTGLNDTVPARTQAVGFTIQSQGYVGCGFDGTNSMKDFWRYDPYNDRWFNCADYKTGPNYEEPDPKYVRNAIGFGIDDKGYVGLGYKSNNEPVSKYSMELWVYRPW